MKRAVGYIRRSKVDVSSPGNVSRDTQVAAIRAMAGEPNLLMLEDWGKSGRGKSRHKRTEFGRLLAMVTADEVSCIYAYNLSRLGRNVRDVLDLVNLCAEHGTAVRLADGLNIDPSTATGRMLITVLAAVDEWQAEVQAERTADGLAAWREAHPDETLGRKPYGDEPGESVEVVLSVYERHGSFLRAAKALTAMGVPTRMGNPVWDTRTLARIVRKARPDLPTAPRGMAIRRPHPFTGLLVCHCGATLTSMPRKDASTAYYCRDAHRDQTHSRPYVVAETKVQRWAEAELARVGAFYAARYVPDGSAPSRQPLVDRIAALDAKRERIVDAAMDGTITKADRDRRIALVVAERAKAEASLANLTGMALDATGPLVDWTLPPDEVNATLRGLWQRIVMNGGMAPKRAVWVATEDYDEEGPA